MDTDNGHPSTAAERTGSPAGAPGRGRFWPAVRLAEVRLRLPAVLLVAALVVGQWELLRNHFDRLIHRTPSESIIGHPVSADTEYFCPMDPGILSDWPGRCGVCNMALVRRRKGEAVVLPDGVVARMQLSPYRVQLAGIQTAPAEFRPLTREWSTSGFVIRDGKKARIDLDVPPRQASWMTDGSDVRVTCSDLPGLTLSGQVHFDGPEPSGAGARPSAAVVIHDPPRELRSGLVATIRATVAVASLEPFRSMPRNPPALAPREPRRLYVCADHEDSTALRAGRCPLDGKERMPRDLAGFERLRWWCPMHPEVTAEQPGSSCRLCGGMELRPHAATYAPAGQVLAVPQSSVVDTGERTVVFVEGMPGLFDGVEVELGARCGDFYPVVRGIQPGHRVAVTGAFLLDAETRLNPSLASGYFGAAGGRKNGPAEGSPSARPTATKLDAPDDTAATALQRLNPADRPLAVRQKVCPVTGLRLGSMGTPERQEVAGRVVFLCCGGCRSKLLADPPKFLARIPAP